MKPDDYRDETSQMEAVRLVNELEDRLKRDIIDEVKESLSQFLGNLKESLEKSLRKSGAKQDQILELLNDPLLSSETEREKLGQEMERLEETVRTALQEKAEAEKKLHEANKIKEALNTRLNACMEELNNTVTLAETFFHEKAQLEKKLAQLQENWESNVANR